MDDSSVLNNEPGQPSNPAVARLIARLEAATEGSRYLDHLIVCALENPSPDYAWSESKWERLEPEVGWQYPLYTTSLDAALTLVPEGWRDDVDLELSLGRFGERLGAKSCFACLATGHIQTPSTKQVTAHAYTPALALCIAALKAHLAPQTEPVSPGSAPNTDDPNNSSRSITGRQEEHER